MTTDHPSFVLIESSPIALWGIDGEERLRRALRRAGLVRELAGGTPAAANEAVLMLRTDHVYDESVVRGAHLSALIERAVAEDSQHPSTPEDAKE